MKTITNFQELSHIFQQLPIKPKVAVVAPDDDHIIKVVERCVEENSADILLVTDRQLPDSLQSLADNNKVSVIQCESMEQAALQGVEAVSTHHADVLMKGTISTEQLLKAVLTKEIGLMKHGGIMSHATLAHMESFGRLILFSDAAVIPSPTAPQLSAMVGYDTEICRALGIEQPKVALIHFSEKTNPKFEITSYYSWIKGLATEGEYGNAIVDGPMDCKTACDKHSAEIKGIESPVAGKADILIFANLEAGNTFYKSISFFAHASMAGIITGADAPIVIPSRADSWHSKYYSLALACIVASHQNSNR